MALGALGEGSPETVASGCTLMGSRGSWTKEAGWEWQRGGTAGEGTTCVKWGTGHAQSMGGIEG